MFVLSAPAFTEWIFILLALTFFILPVLCLIDIIKSRFADSSNKVVWIVIVLLLPYLGSFLYLLLGRRQRIAA